MRNQILLALIIFQLLSFSGFSQSKLIKEKIIYWDTEFAVWKNSRFKIFEYKEDNSLDKIKSYQWDSEANNWKHVRNEYYEYDKNGNEIKKEGYVVVRGELLKEGYLERIYNDEGCLSTEEKFQGQFSYQHDYTFYENCQKESLTKFLLDRSPFKWYKEEKFEYSTDSNDTIDIFEHLVWDYGGLNDWVPFATGFNIYDNEGRMLESYQFSNNGSEPLEKKSIWTYDDIKKTKVQRDYVKFSGENWLLDRIDSLSREFNDKGLLLKESEFRIPGIGATSNDHYVTHTNYNYYCNDLVKEKDFEYLGRLGVHKTKTFYEYDSSIRCGNNITFDMTINPNPSTGWVNISSSLLAGEQSEILVFSFERHFLSAHPVNNLTDFFDLDLSNLPKGIYILQVKNSQHSLSKKLIIL